MKEENGNQDVGATAFDYPNSQHPQYNFKPYYGNQYVPHRTNAAAKVVHPEAIMRAVNEGK